MSIQFVKKPTMPNNTAMTWPQAAAIFVALAYGKNIANTARSTRPPSMGKAGSRLNATKVTLIEIN